MTLDIGRAASATLVETYLKSSREARATLADQISLQLPDYVREVVTSEAAFYIDPRHLPYKNIRFPRLREVLSDEYGLAFVPPQGGGFNTSRLRSTANTEDQFGQLLLQSDDPELTFEDGLLRLPDQRGFRIERLSLRGQVVVAKVASTSKVAEQLIREAIPLLWALAGMRKGWEELQPAVHVMKYGTATSVKFESDRGFLSPQLLAQFDKWAEPGGLASRMGDRGSEPVLKRAAADYFVDELHIMFKGPSDDSLLRIAVRVVTDRGTGVMTVSSELPFDDHLELLESLATGVRGT